MSKKNNPKSISLADSVIIKPCAVASVIWIVNIMFIIIVR